MSCKNVCSFVMSDAYSAAMKLLCSWGENSIETT
jgi:hypothetical protein